MRRMSIPVKQMSPAMVRSCLEAAERTLRESEKALKALRVEVRTLEQRRLFREARLLTKPMVHAVRQARMNRSHRDSLKVEAKRRGLQ